jgi:hypothetical protein
MPTKEEKAQMDQKKSQQIAIPSPVHSAHYCRPSEAAAEPQSTGQCHGRETHAAELPAAAEE